MNIKNQLFTAVVTGMFAFTACNTENNKNTASNNESYDQKEVLNAQEEENKFLIEAYQLSLLEKSMGALAQQKGTTAEIKDLGKMMEQQHQAAASEIETLARSRSLQLPSDISEIGTREYDNLMEKSGDDFNKAYSDRAVQDHEDAIKLYEKTAENQDIQPEVSTWATAQLPMLRMHLDKAKTCKENNKKS